jgi:[acyl-carrier-protein] S-malonyltransferase
MKTAFLFPGQGAQAVGMGKEIAQKFEAAAGIFERANAIIGFNYFKQYMLRGTGGNIKHDDGFATSDFCNFSGHTGSF